MEAHEALDILVSGGVISSGRAREILGMSPDEQREHWRKTHDLAVGTPIHAEIRRESEGLSRLIVRVEVRGVWRTIIDSLHVDGGHTSEIVEPRMWRDTVQRAEAMKGTRNPQILAEPCECGSYVKGDHAEGCPHDAF